MRARIQAAGLAFWLACATAIVVGEIRGPGTKAEPAPSKPFESFRLPHPKPHYPALSE